MSKDAQTKKATWHGPFQALMPDGTVLEPGDSYDVPAAQADSAHWRPVTSSKKDAD